jgi:hypothetical protein
MRTRVDVLTPQYRPGQPGTYFRRPLTPSVAAVARADIYALYVRSGLPLGDEQVWAEIERLGESFDDLGFLNLAAEFLEMASELLSRGHKDPAAVIAGAVLTDHLHRLAARHSVPLVVDGQPKRAQALNDDLVEIRAYNRLQGDLVAPWLALADDAVHERYDRYDTEQALAMMAGVSMLLRWTVPLGAVEKSALGADSKVKDTTSPTGWFGDVG